MARFLFAWELGGGMGHCVKLAPLVTGLLAHGHDVYFAARDVVTAQRILQNHSVKYLQAPFLLARPTETIKHPRSFAQVLHNIGFGDDKQLGAVVNAWRDLMGLVRPSVIVCEHSPSALVAARETGVRRVVVGTGFSLPPDISPLPDLCPWVSATPSDLGHHEAVILERVNRLLASRNADPLDRLSQLYADTSLSLLMTFPELDQHPGRGPTEYWGNWPLPGGLGVTWPPNSHPRVFAYLKSTAGPWRVESALAFLRELPLSTIAYVPGASKALNRFESSGLRICTSRVDLSTIWPGCDLAILNGMAGTATQCLLAGKPLLMVPLFLEQIVLSRRVVEMGAGLIAEPNRMESFAARLWRLLHEDQFCHAAQQFSQQYANYNAAQMQEAAVNRLLHCLESVPPQGC